MLAAMDHAGRAVVFSGLTVAIGLLSMIVLPVAMLRSVGIGGVLVPLVSVAVAITLLPVVLATIGPRLDWPRLRTERSASRVFSAWARGVYRHRWLAALGGIAILAALMLPALSLHLGLPGSSAEATSGPAHAALTTLTKGGVPAGVLTPAEVLTSGNPKSVSAVRAAAAKVPGVYTAVAPATGDYHRAGTAIVTVLPTAESSGPAGQATMRQLEAALLPDQHVLGVGGEGPSLIDFDHSVYGSFPIMLTIIAVATFLLLTRAFRSVVLAAKAVFFNLVSLAAAYGVLTWVWQDGHGSSAVWGLPSDRRDHHVGAADGVRVPVRAVHGLRGLHPDPDPRGLRHQRQPPARRDRGAWPDRAPGHQRGGHPDAQLPVDVHRAADRPEDPGHRPRRRHPHRRRRHQVPAWSRRWWRCSERPTGGCQAGSAGCSGCPPGHRRQQPSRPGCSPPLASSTAGGRPIRLGSAARSVLCIVGLPAGMRQPMSHLDSWPAGHRYQLEQWLGAGGYSQVWRARDTVLDREVAVKLLHGAYSGDIEAATRFAAEARHGGALSHENIARVYDYGEPGSDTPPYLVLELVDGPSLAERLARGPLPVPQALDVIAQAATGLDAAHTAGLVHRDIKPANLLLSPAGTLKITDFGISHALGSVPITGTGMVMGTSGYLAPERSAGASATAASDIYALGVVGFECLAGAPPFAWRATRAGAGAP